VEVKPKVKVPYRTSVAGDKKGSYRETLHPWLAGSALLFERLGGDFSKKDLFLGRFGPLLECVCCIPFFCPLVLLGCRAHRRFLNF
jgi:hypothetical protein